jgi:hypothetical protein
LAEAQNAFDEGIQWPPPDDENERVYSLFELGQCIGDLIAVNGGLDWAFQTGPEWPDRILDETEHYADNLGADFAKGARALFARGLLHGAWAHWQTEGFDIRDTVGLRRAIDRRRDSGRFTF